VIGSVLRVETLRVEWRRSVERNNSYENHFGWTEVER